MPSFRRLFFCGIGATCLGRRELSGGTIEVSLYRTSCIQTNKVHVENHATGKRAGQSGGRWAEITREITCIACTRAVWKREISMLLKRRYLRRNSASQLFSRAEQTRVPEELRASATLNRACADLQRRIRLHINKSLGYGLCHCAKTVFQKRRPVRLAQSAAINRRSRCGSVRGWPVLSSQFSPGAAPQVGQGTASTCFGLSSFFGSYTARMLLTSRVFL